MRGRRVAQQIHGAPGLGRQVLDTAQDAYADALDDAEVAVVAYGVTSRAARRAVALARQQGLRAGLFRSRTLWPSPEAELRRLAEQVRTLVVAEMNMGQLIYEVERCAAGRARVLGCLRADGQPLSPDDILASLQAGAEEQA